ncbi:MAG: DNA polymerase Y family protein, partial [Microcella sp.]|nr:DNA polymerase Y family protein [Microcella sp.]
MQRTLVLWVPDWPVIAAVREGLAASGSPIAVMAANRVVACSPAARSEGVRAGQRRREAQSLCTSLVVVPFDEGR